MQFCLKRTSTTSHRSTLPPRHHTQTSLPWPRSHPRVEPAVPTMNGDQHQENAREPKLCARGCGFFA